MINFKDVGVDLDPRLFIDDNFKNTTHSLFCLTVFIKTLALRIHQFYCRHQFVIFHSFSVYYQWLSSITLQILYNIYFLFLRRLWLPSFISHIFPCKRLLIYPQDVKLSLDNFLKYVIPCGFYVISYISFFIMQFKIIQSHLQL